MDLKVFITTGESVCSECGEELGLTGYRWALGVYFGATKGIVEVCTDNEIVGWGEVATVEQVDTVTNEFS